MTTKPDLAALAREFEQRVAMLRLHGNDAAELATQWCLGRLRLLSEPAAEADRRALATDQRVTSASAQSRMAEFYGEACACRVVVRCSTCQETLPAPSLTVGDVANCYCGQPMAAFMQNAELVAAQEQVRTLLRTLEAAAPLFEAAHTLATRNLVVDAANAAEACKQWARSETGQRWKKEQGK